MNRKKSDPSVYRQCPTTIICALLPEVLAVILLFSFSAVTAQPYQPDSNGEVVIEAENFELNVSMGGRDWIPDFTPGYVGTSAMLSDPNSWLSVSSNIATSSPRMDYEVEFATAVNLNVWIRGLGRSGSTDSVWVGVDGDDSTVLRVNPTRGAWGWETNSEQLVVPAGVHTINIWMREDGTIVDRMLLTPLSTVPSGDGPAESGRGPADPGNTWPIAINDAFTVSEDSVANALSVLADNGGAGADYDPDGDPVTVVSATSPGSAGGSIVVNATSDGLEYTPAADFAGTESFDYGISDGRGGTATATVTVTVNNTNNDPPVLAPVGNRVVTEGQTLALVLTATDVDGAPVPAITANLTALSGSPAFTDLGNGTASFSWTPSVGDAPGPYSVTFTAVDAVNSALTSAETISIAVQAADSGGGTGAYQPDAAGQVVIEAENFDLNVSQGGRDWIPDFTAGYVGDSAMLSDPNSWLSVSSNIATNSPRMDYQVEYAAPASLNVWVRGLGPSGSADSIWVGLDGDDSNVLRINPTRGTWGWETAAAQLSVPAGVHTINIWMREDGTIVDRLLLTPISTVPSGNGPTESSREGGAPANNVPVAANDAFIVAEDSVSNALAVLADNGAGPDYDPDGDPINVVSVTSPGSAGGSIVVNGASNGVLYTPASNFAGTETFSYTIGDGRGGLATALASVTVNNTNNDVPLLAPIGNRTATENQATSFVVTASDVDGPPVPTLTANLDQLSGSPVFIDNGDGSGSFSWTPTSGDSPGPYAVTFTAIDAVNSALTASETISIDVQAAGGGGTGAWQPDGNGQFVIEAEHFDLNVSQGGRNWVEDFTPGYVGDSAMLSDPNSWLSVSSNIATSSPRMDYEIELATAADLNVWIRGLGPSGSADSIWVGVDGDDTTALRVNPTRAAWGWETASASLSVPAGVHTINVWMREDGTIVDRLLLTPQSTVPSGDGPAESSRGSGGGGTGLPLIDDFADGIADGWMTFDDGIQFPSDWGVAAQAYVQSARTNSSGKDVTETYHRGSFAYMMASAGLTDYRVSVDVLPGAESADDIGVMVRYTNDSNYYRISLNSLNGFARLESNLSGTFRTLASNLRGYRPGELQNIVVVAEGSLIQVFLNGDPLFSVHDGDHPAGGIALFSRDNSTFDNVAVTAPGLAPEIVIAAPEAHTVVPNGPVDLTVTSIARNVPSPNGSVSVQYLNGGPPVLCNAAAEGPAGVFTATCPGMPVGDYMLEALLLDNGAEVDRDSNASVAIGSIASGGHRYDAIGDSITRGVGDNYSADNLDLFDQRTIGVSGWPALLGDLLTQSTGVPNLVANEGIPGDRASDTQVQRLLSIIERNPDSNRSLIMLGTNDSNDFNTTSEVNLVADIQSIINTLRANGRDVIYLSQLPPAFGASLSTPFIDPLAPSATRNQTIIDYNAAIRGMLPQTGVLPGPDLFSCFLTDTVNRFSLFEDSLHPNALGHAMIAALWRDAIVNGPVVAPVDPCAAPIYILESLDGYSHKQNLLEAGDRYYTDEAFTLTNVPAELDGGIWVMQANADNSNADANYLSFDAGTNPVTVYIAFDPAGNPPTSSTHAFSAVGLSGNLSVSDPGVGSFNVVRASGVTGSVSIGGNKSGGSAAAQQAYLIIVVP
jgi:lysophospholipase L1-like esterase